MKTTINYIGIIKASIPIKEQLLFFIVKSNRTAFTASIPIKEQLLFKGENI